MICPNAYYIECPYLYEVVYEGRRVTVDARETCPFCCGECEKENVK